MIVLSLFDGISCGRVALERAGINIKKYYSSEIDKYAIKISEANYPDIVRLGDVTNWKEWAIDWGSVDLLIGGSPCQGFSFAGKQLAFDDPRSALFFTFVDILNHIKSLNPNVKFLLENVRMKKEFIDVISEYLDVCPVMINSSLVSAQSRPRFYWSNFEFTHPQDKAFILKDIIEDAKFDRPCELLEKPTKGGHIANAIDIKGNESIKRVYSINAKSPALTTMQGGHRQPKITIDGKNYRKLTVLECERLQTLPDNYTAHVSNTQRYKSIGNGWTVDVIAHIFSTMNIEKKIQERLFA